MAEVKTTRRRPAAKSVAARRKAAEQAAAESVETTGIPLTDDVGAVDTAAFEELLMAQQDVTTSTSLSEANDLEAADLVAEQQVMTKANAPRHHPVGTMDAREFTGEQTILAARSNTSSTNKGEQMKLKGPNSPTQAPIAVVSPDGAVFPFSGETRDRVALLGYDVTYIYDRDDALKVIAHNEKMLRNGNVDRIVHGIPMEAAPLPTRDETAELRENLAVAFSPDMLRG